MPDAPPLLDTDVLIDYLRRRPAARGAVDSLFTGGRGAVASVVTKAEILSGMRAGEEDDTEGALSSLDWIPVTDQVATLSGDRARSHRRTNPGIGLADYLIAATAELLGVELWTQNPRHFPMFEDLEPPYRR